MDFSILENNFLKIYLLDMVISNLIPAPSGMGACVGCLWGCLWGVWGVVSESYRGCYDHSKLGFKIKIEITVFKILDYCFQDYVFEVKPLNAHVTPPVLRSKNVSALLSILFLSF